MTNPVGFAWVDNSTNLVPGLVPAGSALVTSDPAITNAQGVSGGDYTCSGVHQWVNTGGGSGSVTTSGPAASATTLAAVPAEYCFIRVSWNGSSVGSGSLMGSCPPVEVTGSVAVTISMVGFGGLDVGVNDNTDGNPSNEGSRSVLGADPITGIDTGIIPSPFPSLAERMWMPQGLLLRPTALTWDGQDPDNAGNRAIWATSEVADITYDAVATCVAAPPGFGFNIEPAWTVTPLQPVVFPTVCDITPIPEPIPPLGIIASGDSLAGVVRLG